MYVLCVHLSFLVPSTISTVALPVESERENLECVCMLIPFPLCVDVSAAWIVSTGGNCNSSALHFRSTCTHVCTMYVYTCTHVYVHVYIHTYIYTYVCSMCVPHVCETRSTCHVCHVKVRINRLPL